MKNQTFPVGTTIRRMCASNEKLHPRVSIMIEFLIKLIIVLGIVGALIFARILINEKAQTVEAQATLKAKQHIIITDQYQMKINGFKWKVSEFAWKGGRCIVFGSYMISCVPYE